MFRNDFLYVFPCLVFNSLRTLYAHTHMGNTHSYTHTHLALKSPVLSGLFLGVGTTDTEVQRGCSLFPRSFSSLAHQLTFRPVLDFGEATLPSFTFSFPNFKFFHKFLTFPVFLKVFYKSISKKERLATQERAFVKGLSYFSLISISKH